MGRICDVDRLLQIEVEFGFGRDADLLAFGGSFGRGTASSPDAGTDGRTFAAAKNTADNCAGRGTDADSFSGALAARLANILVVVTRQGVRHALEIQAGEMESQLATARHATRRTRICKLDEHVGARRYDGFPVNHDRKSERR